MRKSAPFNVFNPNEVGDPEPCVFCHAPVSVYARTCPACGQTLIGWGPETPPVRDTDLWQTPPAVIDPLLPFVPPGRVWEPCCGAGTLVRALREAGREVIGTDIIHGFDFFDSHPLRGRKKPPGDIIITNPPWHTSSDFLGNCYALRRPFALLLPLYNLAGVRRSDLFRRWGVQLLVFPRRVDFRHPDPKRNGGNPVDGVAWFTWKFNLPSPLEFAD